MVRASTVAGTKGSRSSTTIQSTKALLPVTANAAGANAPMAGELINGSPRVV